MSNMAARGVLRLSNQINISKQNVWNVPRIFIQTSQQSRARSFSLNKVCNFKKSIVSRQSQKYTVTAWQSSILFNQKLSNDQHRNYKTSAIQENEESTEQDEVNGDFNKFSISEVTQQKLRNKGINYLFPVQYCTFKPTIEGTDVIVQARTGTGKTMSFALPIIEKLQKNPERLKIRGRNPLVVVLAPTRELANQVKGVFSSLSSTLQVACLYGGVSLQPQIDAISRGLDVVVGTPGRIKDMMSRGVLDLSELQHVILDEVDTMLDMGFADAVEEIIKDCYTTGQKPQTMLYSATMPDWVKRTARIYLNDHYEMINLVGRQAEQTATTIKQYAVMCRPEEQPTMIQDFLHIYVKNNGRAIVFCNTKNEVMELCSGILRREAKAFHGDIAQASRSFILKGFKDGNFKVLVTTDVAARGLDIPDIDLVIQAQPPKDTNFYIHRVGRTGRAGQSGMSILLFNRSEAQLMKDCERIAKVKFEKLKPPTIDEMLDLCAKSAVRDIIQVPAEVAEHFYDAAEMMIKEKGAKEVVSAAMAAVSKASECFNRSLITRQVGYNTLLYSEGGKSRSMWRAKDIIKGYLEELNVSVKNVHSLQDGHGVVFDVETDNVQVVLKGFDDIKSKDSESVERITVLPEIETKFDQQGLFHHGRQGQFRRHRNFLDDDDSGESFSRSPRKYRFDNNKFDRSQRSHDRQNARHSDRGHFNERGQFSDRGHFNRSFNQRRQKSNPFWDDED